MLPFETRASKTKMTIMVVGSLIFVALGAWIVSMPELFADQRRGALAPYAGWACVIFFGLTGVIALRQLFNSKVQIRVDSVGVYAAKISPDTIPWRAITSVEAMEFKHRSVTQKFAMLRLSEDADITFTRGYKLTKKVNIGFDYKGARIHLNHHVHNPDKILAAIEMGFAQHGGHQ